MAKDQDQSDNLPEDVALAEAWHLYLAARDVLEETKAKYFAAQRAWLERRSL